MKSCLLVLVAAFVAISSFGCVALPLPQVSLSTNIPLSSSTLTVFNKSTDLKLAILVNGVLRKDELDPGQYWTNRLYNFSTNYAYLDVVVVGKDLEGNLIGAGKVQVSVSGYQSYPYTLLVDRQWLSNHTSSY